MDVTKMIAELRQERDQLDAGADHQRGWQR
jgi:hypothetical protein